MPLYIWALDPVIPILSKNLCIVIGGGGVKKKRWWDISISQGTIGHLLLFLFGLSHWEKLSNLTNVDLKRS